MRREYPPGVVFHAPDCVDGGNATALPLGAAKEVYPSHQFDVCATPGDTPYVAVEHVHIGKTHEYAQSDKWPNDATRPLCRVCRGTHGDKTPTEPGPSGLPQRPSLIVRR